MHSFRLDDNRWAKHMTITSYLFTRGLIKKKKYTEALEYLIDNFELDVEDEEA